MTSGRKLTRAQIDLILSLVAVRRDGHRFFTCRQIADQAEVSERTVARLVWDVAGCCGKDFPDCPCKSQVRADRPHGN